MLTQLQVTSLTLVFSIALMPTLAQSTTNTLSFAKRGLYPIAKTIPNQLVANDRDLTDISIGSIKIGMTLKQVTNKLGKPDRTSQISDPCSGAKRITLRYPRLVITALHYLVC